jgi:outer membrane protein assembly factor BamB
MGFLMSKRQINTIILLALIIIGCASKLRIKEFHTENSADTSPFLTSQLNYSRNTVSTKELKPPLTEDWENEFKALPYNGFTAIDNWMFFGMKNGFVAAVDIENGKLEGKKNLGDACAVPPTIDNNILYQTFEIGSYGLIAYDLSDGSTLWELEGHLSRSAPIVIDDIVIFQSLRGEIIGLNHMTGEEIWRISLKRDIRNSPAYKDKLAITITLDGLVIAVEPKSGSIVWEQELNTPVFADPVIEGNVLYVVTHSGKLQLLDLNDGNLLSETSFNIELYNSPAIDQRFIYLATSNGILYTLNKTTLKKEWTFSGDGPISGFALVTDTYIYLATLAKKLYILDKRDGTPIQEIELAGRARSAPIISQGKLFLACEDRRVIAYVEE